MRVLLTTFAGFHFQKCLFLNIGSPENKMEKTITIAAPIRDREWVLPCYLNHIFNLNYPKEKITLLWIVNESLDNSSNILKQFKFQHINLYNNIHILEKPIIGLDNDSRFINNNKFVRIDQIYKHLANLRNEICDFAITDYLFSVDSDILLIDKDIIFKLLSHDKKIVSSIIWNGYEFSDKPYMYSNAIHTKDWINIAPFNKINVKNILRKDHISNLQEVDITGACYLLHKDVYNNKNIRYKEHMHGEDLMFCKNAKEQGYKLYVDVSIYSQHIMNKMCLESWKENKLIF